MSSTQLLASNEDIEELVGVPVTNELLGPIQVQVYRIVRSELAPRYSPVTLAGWSDPEHTPDVIRKIATKLVVAYLIGHQEYYDEAMRELKELASDA